MVFCPKCKSLMFPKDDIFVCSKCGYKKKKTGSVIVVERQTEKETVMLENKNIDVLPKIRTECPKCGYNEAFWILRQTRSSDEPETRIYTCVKCGHRWRAY